MKNLFYLMKKNQDAKIQELWIIARNGLHIFSQKISSNHKDLGKNNLNDRIGKINEDFFSGFVAAINAFTSEIGLDKCRVLETKSSKLVFSHHPDLDLTFVARSNKNINNSEIFDYLESIKSNFILKYNKIIKNWSGSVTEFKGISKKIDIDKDKKNWK